MALYSYGPIQLWLYIGMAYIVMAYIVMALYSYGAYNLVLRRLRVVDLAVTYFSHGPHSSWPAWSCPA